MDSVWSILPEYVVGVGGGGGEGCIRDTHFHHLALGISCSVGFSLDLCGLVSHACGNVVSKSVCMV